jgi:hypothetical protein
MVVSQNINVPVMQKSLYNSNYKRLSYILDPDQYGTDEAMKQLKFISALSGKVTDSTGAVPKTIIIQKGNNNITILNGETNNKQVLDLLHK